MKRALIMILLIVISGCDIFGGSNGQPTTEQARTGTSSLSMSILPNQPPARIFVQPGRQTEVIVGIDLRNNGAEPINGGVLSYQGFDPNLISFPSGGSIPHMDGKVSVPSGGRELVQFNGFVNANVIGESYKPNLQITACFPYRTEAEIPMCIDPNPTAQGSKACTASDFSGSGQGGPIAVTSVEQDTAPGSTLFKIVIKNSGGGDVFVGGPQKCQAGASALDFRSLDKVYLQSVTISGNPINCRGTDPSGNIPLNGGQAVIFCDFVPPAGSAYQTMMKVNLQYDYRISTSKSLEIVKLS